MSSAPEPDGDDAGGAFAAPTPTPRKASTAKKAAARVRETLRPVPPTLEQVKEPGDVDGEQAPGTPAKRRRSGTTGAERARRAQTQARKSLAAPFAGVYGRLGAIAEQSGNHDLVPFGRAVQFNAPVAGYAFDQLVKGTPIDKLLQPAAAKGDELQTFLQAVGMPLMVLAMTLRPESWPVFAPMVEAMLEANIVAMGPVIVEKKKRDKATAQTMKELAAEGMIPTGPAGEIPTVSELMALMFQQFAEPPAPAPAPET